MKRRKPIDAGTVLRGDKVRATWTTGDVTRTVEGRVSAVIYEGTRREFRAVGGGTLYVWELGSALNPDVELLDPAPPVQEPLPGL